LMKGVSVIIRTKNEGRYLDTVLGKVFDQEGDFTIEVIVVDSGSTDNTRDIAHSYGCRVIVITPDEFTWGLALNIGMEAASNEYCVLLSGHCVPVDNHWLDEITKPLSAPDIAAVCGRQVPVRNLDPFEEVELERWFPQRPGDTPYRMFTSANGCLKKSLWQIFRFRELLNSLEDEDLSNRLHRIGYSIRYVPAASVFHSHPLSLRGIYRRWYWRSRVGMSLRKDANPKIMLASRSALLAIRVLITTSGYFTRYFFGSIHTCLKNGYVRHLWKLPFYEIVRQHAIYSGLKDGLMDVRHDEMPGEFLYFKKEIPGFVSVFRFIEES
ncbi:MAG: glycosyltransferase, partial [Chloroflexota bacterium]